MKSYISIPYTYNRIPNYFYKTGHKLICSLIHYSGEHGYSCNGLLYSSFREAFYKFRRGYTLTWIGVEK